MGLFLKALDTVTFDASPQHPSGKVKDAAKDHGEDDLEDQRQDVKIRE